MSEEDGGVVAEIIKKYKFCIFNCTCKHRIETPNFQGYTHSGGFADKMGSKWWLYIECSNCKYCWAVNKLDRRIMKYDDNQIATDGVNKYELFFKEVCMIHEEKLRMGIPNLFNSPCLVYSLPHKGRKVTCTPILADHGHSPLEYVQGVLNRMKPMVYVVVAEAWMGKKKQNAEDVRKDPEKQEMMVCTGKSFDGTFNTTKMWKVIRGGEDNKATDVIQVADSDTIYSDKLP